MERNVGLKLWYTLLMVERLALEAWQSSDCYCVCEIYPVED